MADNLTDFERGALWALKLLREAVNERGDTVMRSTLDPDTRQVLLASQTVLVGTMIKVEHRLVTEIKDPKKEKTP